MVISPLDTSLYPPQLYEMRALLITISRRVARSVPTRKPSQPSKKCCKHVTPNMCSPKPGHPLVSTAKRPPMSRATQPTDVYSLRSSPPHHHPPPTLAP